jgi:hypothetical protein
MSQRAGDLGSKYLAAQSRGQTYDPVTDTFTDKKKPEDTTNPKSEIEGLFGVRMSKGQKWAWVIGITLAIYGVTYYVNKK